jgi:serine/threonine-protein kinase
LKGWPEVPGYEIVGELGRGGMGVVYQARHLQLNRRVALKMILAGAHAGEQDLARFRDETQAVAGMQHPNIVQIFEVGEQDGRPFCALELVPGGSLAQHLDGTPWPARPAAELVETLARAMHHAHEQGIVHRDLKPGNILLASGGREPPGDAAPPGGSRPPLADLTPKITDFGLAKRLGEKGQTVSGAIVGTPSYMAPEQAAAKGQEIGPAADVYALGAILYELLTGRPPFRAETPLDTVLQVLSEEPVPPRRLNAKVPRDLETICLKCLQKAAPRRYGSALELAEDLGRFLHDEPIRARPVGRVEHLVKWARRRPAVAALWGLSLTVALVGGGVWLWLAQERAEQQAEAARQEAVLRQGVAAALDKAADLQQRARWDEADAVLEQAQERLGKSGPADLRERVGQVRADLRLVRRLDAARLLAATIVGNRLDSTGAEREYAAAFREGRLELPGDEVGVVAARLRASAVKAQLVAALDAWASVTRNPQRRAWLLAVARQADPDAWRDRFRDPRVWEDRVALEQLARQARVQQLSPQLLKTLAVVLREAGGDAVPVLTAAQARSPQDFWLNFELGSALQWRKRAGEAVGYYRAALALRPNASAVYTNLGLALHDKGQLDQAIACFQKAVVLDPKAAKAQYNLGAVLHDKGEVDQAIACFQKAVALDPKDATAHYNLGNALKAKGELDGAIACFQKALAIEPKDAQAQNNLGVALYTKGEVEQAIACFEKALALDPKHAHAHTNLGNALADKGQLDRAIACFQKALAIDPKHAKAYISLGAILCDVKHDYEEAIACFRKALALDSKNVKAHYNLGLTLQKKGELDRAIAWYEKALAIDPKLAQVQTGLGLALMGKGQLDRAIACYEKALTIDPKDATATSALGEALLRQGRFRQARDSLRRCLQLLPPRHFLRSHASRQLAQSERWLALEARLPSILKGEIQPASASERFEYAVLCRYKQLYAAGARFAADAFVAEPQLAADLRNNHRYSAAGFAAMAAAGQGQDKHLDARERSRWRRQALAWLRADLDLWTKVWQTGQPQARAHAAVQQWLQYWQRDPALAGVRDAAWLVNLPADELRACRQLWADVAALLARAQGKK